MTETEFIEQSSRVFDGLEDAFEAADCDADVSGNVFTAILPDESTIVINKQTPMREIWVASKAGGRHFRSDNGAWTDTRTGEELFDYLARILKEKYSIKAEFKKP